MLSAAGTFAVVLTVFMLYFPRLVFPFFSCYSYLVTIEQTIEIPANHRIYFDVPFQVPAGRAKVALTIIEFPQTAPPGHEEAPVIPLLELRGSCKGEDTLDAYLERKRADKALEFEHDRRLSGLKA
jgi:hypothetical protein